MCRELESASSATGTHINMQGVGSSQAGHMACKMSCVQGGRVCVCGGGGAPESSFEVNRCVAPTDNELFRCTGLTHPPSQHSPRLPAAVHAPPSPDAPAVGSGRCWCHSLRVLRAGGSATKWSRAGPGYSSECDSGSVTGL